MSTLPMPAEIATSTDRKVLIAYAYGCSDGCSFAHLNVHQLREENIALRWAVAILLALLAAVSWYAFLPRS